MKIHVKSKKWCGIELVPKNGCREGEREREREIDVIHGEKLRRPKYRG